MPDNQIIKRSLTAGSDCLPIEDLSGSLQLPAGNPVRQAAEIHLSHCLHCRTEADLLSQFESGVIRAEEADAVRWISARLARSNPVKNTAVLTPAGTRQRWWSPQVFGWFGAAAAV